MQSIGLEKENIKELLKAFIILGKGIKITTPIISCDMDKAFDYLEKEIGYLGQNKQVVDINLVVNHLGKKTGSEIQVDGTLKDEAEKTFRGTIDFKNGSSQPTSLSKV